MYFAFVIQRNEKKYKMKKVILISLIALFACAVSSCDSKSCRCYIYDGVNPVYKEIEYVSDGTACSSLNYRNGNKYRSCVEMNEPDIDPNEIGQEYKK